VDHDLPVLRATDSNGKLIALLINYACHGTTLVPEHNFIHGDWMGATQEMIEQKYLGSTVMVAIGCGGDANPSPRGEFGHVNQHAIMITDKINQLLQADKFIALNSIPDGKMKNVELRFTHVPDVKELVEQSKLEAAQGPLRQKQPVNTGRRWFDFQHHDLPNSSMEFWKSVGYGVLGWRGCCGL
jgi:hypothetical protein